VTGGDNSQANDKHRARMERIAKARTDLAKRYAENPDQVQQFNVRMARLAAARKREQERFDHLVARHPRPTEIVTVGKKKGRRKPKKVEVPVTLSPGMNEAVAMEERWSHKANGTAQTHERAGRHTDSLDQLERNGTIAKEEREWAAQIANVHRSIESDVAVKIASIETRVDNGGSRPLVAERIHRVRMHAAYGFWRQMIPVPRGLVLDMIVGDAIGISVAAKLYHVHKRKAKRLLIEAIKRWPLCVAHAFSIVDQETVDAMNRATAPSRYTPSRPMLAVEYQHAWELERAYEKTDEPYLLPPMDPAFLDERGFLRPWAEIADIIRGRMAGELESEAA